jgi:hypothetical protein
MLHRHTTKPAITILIELHGHGALKVRELAVRRLLKQCT